MRIFLIGMPGSGKTTFGRRLAEQYGYPFLDLDREIELNFGETISSIFEKKGEGFFRKLEANTLRKVISNIDNAVVATGGGTPCFEDNLLFMKKYGHVIYLKVPLNILIERLEKEQHRPLLKVKKELKTVLEEMLEKRRKFYELADFNVVDYEELVNKLNILKKE